jgi:aminopeptidase
MMRDWGTIAALAVHGANVQAGQVVLVTAELGQEELARAVASACYDRGAIYVDVIYFDPHLKLQRVRAAAPETLEYVPPWYGERALEHAEGHGARVTIAGVTEPHLFDGLDPALVGRDRLPWLKEIPLIVSERLMNWTIVPCPHPAWAELVYGGPAGDALERLWRDLLHVLRLDEPDPVAAWEERMQVLNGAADRLTDRAFDAVELRGPGTELTLGLLPGHRWWAADFTTVDGLRHLPNLPTEEVFTTPDPLRADGHVTSTKPLVVGGSIIRGLRVTFEGGKAVDIRADENAAVLHSHLHADEGALRLGELALVDRIGRIGALGTTFYHTLLDENAASHLAFGSGFPFLVDPAQVSRVNESAVHVDFMVGSPEVDVDGVTAGGQRVPVLRGGDWQI